MSEQDKQVQDVAESVAAMAAFSEEGYENFLSVDREKQTRITQAAFEEFAAHDYAQASTNAIVKEAGISKGLLFHYFGSKAGLYQYLLQRYVTLATSAVLEGTDFSGGDVFEVLWKTTEVKMQVAMRLPLETRFYTRSLIDSSVPSELRAVSDNTVNAAFSAMEQITQSLDEKLLKDGMDPQKVAKIIDLVCSGITHEIIADMTPEVTLHYWQEQSEYVKGYFDFMRQLFYKDVQEGDSQ